MMKWIDRALFDELLLANGDPAEAMTRDAQMLLDEVLPFIPDAALQYRIYHDEATRTNYLESVRIGFERNDMLLSISKQTYPKPTYRISCCSDDELRHIDSYSRTRARSGLAVPQRIGKLSRRKIDEWVEYHTRYYRYLERMDRENEASIADFRRKIEAQPDVKWGADRNRGRIERDGIIFVFEIQRTGYCQSVYLDDRIRTLEDFQTLTAHASVRNL